MKVKDCQSCSECARLVWKSYHVPKNYHPIGISHAYAFCLYHQKRIREIKKCDRRDGKQDDR